MRRRSEAQAISAALIGDTNTSVSSDSNMAAAAFDKASGSETAQMMQQVSSKILTFAAFPNFLQESLELLNRIWSERCLGHTPVE